MSTLLRRRGDTGSRRRTATFNPLTQVTPLHAMWASDPAWSAPADGGAVSSWRNSTGGGDPAQASGTLQPLYRASVSQLGNKPAIEFDGSDDDLGFNIADVAQQFKVLIVGRFTANNSTNRTMIGFGAGATQGFGITSSNRTYLHAGSQISPAAGTVGTAGHVWRCNANGGSSEYWQDGTSQATGGIGSNAMTYIRLGAGSQGTTNISRWTACQLAFYAVYDSATSDSDLATLAADLKTHYGL